MNAAAPIIDIFLSHIENLLIFNKEAAKTYLKLSKAAFAPELAKALGPEQTAIKSQISRMQLIKKLYQQKAQSTSPLLAINPIKLSRTKSAAQDLQLIHAALQLLAVQNSQYQAILKLMEATKPAHVPELIDQCISENKDTETWITRTLVQLSQS